MDLGSLEQVGLQLLTMVLLAALTVLAEYTRRWIAKHVDDKDLQQSLQATRESVFTAVRNELQLMDAEAEKAVADGKLSKDELLKIQQAAIRHYQEHVAPDMKRRLEAHVGDAKKWVAKETAAAIQSLDKVTN